MFLSEDYETNKLTLRKGVGNAKREGSNTIGSVSVSGRIE